MSKRSINGGRTKSAPAMSTAEGVRFQIGGEVGRRLDAVTQQWILPAVAANPAMLEMFRNRDREPLQSQVPWAGEFAGKYLTHAVQIHRLTRNPALASHVQCFVGELVQLQDVDGYLGPWPRAFRMKRGCPTCAEPWDAWGHYHAMLGLLLWHQDTGDARAIGCAQRIGDYFCSRFLNNPNEKLHDTGAHEMNQAPAHALALLYQATGEKRYLAMARQIVREFAIPPAGDYLRQGRANVPFHRTPKPRWESLHPIMALVELYYITGDIGHRTAFENLWWSMLHGDRHNNGGFTAGEKATGNPYDPGAIETCCTIAWMAMSVEMLKLTGNSVAADELELSLLNSGLGMMSPSGRWVTYNTPMDGHRRASADHIVFQARAGSPELNCCSVNGPRALGMISDWALMRRGDAVVLNYYGPGTLETTLASGNRVRLAQQTEYPIRPHVDIALALDTSERFTLALRVPYWSRRTKLHINNNPVRSVKPGSYVNLTRIWATGDRVTVELDFTPHFWVRPRSGSADFDATWTIFGPVPPTDAEVKDGQACPMIEIKPPLDGVRRTPRSLIINGKRYTGRRLRSERGIVADDRTMPGAGGRASLIAITTIRSNRIRTLKLDYTVDWWSAWYVNGRKLADNMTDRLGNQGPLEERCHAIEIPLKKGDNLVALVIGGGVSRGAWASIGLAGVPAKTEAGVQDASIYVGPTLLAYDPRYNHDSLRMLPPIRADRASDARPIVPTTWLKPQMLRELAADNGTSLPLCDFASAGVAGNSYTTWLPVRFKRVPRTKVSKQRPLPTFRLDGL